MKRNKPALNTNVRLVLDWLKARDRNYAYLARQTGLHESSLTLFFSGKRASPELIARLADYTKLPLTFSIDKIKVTCNKE